MGIAVGAATFDTRGLAGGAGGVLGERRKLLVVAAGVGDVAGVDLGGDGGCGGGEGAGDGGGDVVEDVAGDRRRSGRGGCGCGGR